MNLFGKNASQKDLLREDIIIYSVILFSTLTFDLFYNALFHLRLLSDALVAKEPLGHPVSFGILQLSIIIFCVIQLLRKYNQVKWLA